MLPLFRIDETLAVEPPEPANFVGRVRMQNLAAAGGSDELEYFAVHFDAGAHARPHTHSTDQVLYYLTGTGFVWVAGEERQLAPPGTVVVVPAGLVHMHGATDDEPICHIAVRAPGPADWNPPVPDDWRRFQG